MFIYIMYSKFGFGSLFGNGAGGGEHWEGASPLSKKKTKTYVLLLASISPCFAVWEKHYLQCFGADLQHSGLEFLLWFLFFHVGIGLSWLCCPLIFLRCCLHLSCSTPPKHGKSKQKQQKHKATQPRNQKPQE